MGIEQGKRCHRDRRSEFAQSPGIDEVHGFYSRIRIDPVLGPIFAARIKEWDPHLSRMSAFWSSVVPMTGRYHGRPLQKHALLPVSCSF
jgi:hemoglobin